MSMLSIVLRKVVSAVLFVVHLAKQVLGLVWRRKEKQIGELPFITPPTEVITQGGSGPVGAGAPTLPAVPNFHPSTGYTNTSAYIPQAAPTYQPSAQTNSWNSWNDQTFGVSSKIEEYRKKQEEQRQQAQEERQKEPDYFAELKPEIKSAKQVQITSGRAKTPTPRKDMFAFSEDNQVHIPKRDDFGDLELDASAHAAGHGNSAWDDDNDLDLTQVERDLQQQKLMAREEKQRQRLLEHENRRLQKKRIP